MTSARPAVFCTSCARTWNSDTMVEGLRLVGSCPRCGGVLEFADSPAPDAPEAKAGDEKRELAPHLVLGIPRR